MADKQKTMLHVMGKCKSKPQGHTLHTHYVAYSVFKKENNKCW